jgi:hypothetical protein
MNNVHFFLRQMLRYSSDENFLLILVIYDRWIPCVNNKRIKNNPCKIRHGILQCTVRYGTVNVQLYGTSKCMYPSRDEDCCFYEILFFVTIFSSLHYCLLLTAVVSRCSHPAPVYHRCPYLASDRPSCTHHPLNFFIY